MKLIPILWGNINWKLFLWQSKLWITYILIIDYWYLFEAYYVSDIMPGDFCTLFYLIWMVKIFIPAYVAVKGVRPKSGLLDSTTWTSNQSPAFSLPSLRGWRHVTHCNASDSGQRACRQEEHPGSVLIQLLNTQMWYPLLGVFIIFLCILKCCFYLMEKIWSI